MPPARFEGGSAGFEGRDLLTMPVKELRAIRRKDAGGLRNAKEGETPCLRGIATGMQSEKKRGRVGHNRKEARKFQRGIVVMAQVQVGAVKALPEVRSVPKIAENPSRVAKPGV